MLTDPTIEVLERQIREKQEDVARLTKDIKVLKGSLREGQMRTDRLEAQIWTHRKAQRKEASQRVWDNWPRLHKLFRIPRPTGENS